MKRNKCGFEKRKDKVKRELLNLANQSDQKKYVFLKFNQENQVQTFPLKKTSL